MREIQAYSSNSSDELDYTKRYWFNHWIDKTTTALIEDERGQLRIAKITEFRFKTSSDVSKLEGLD